MNLLQEKLLDSYYLQMDETYIQVLNEKGKKATTKSYLWVRLRPYGEKIVLFDYDPTRSGKVPQKLLNINVRNKKIVSSSKCKKAIKLAKRLLKNKGRLLVRPSGTEPKIRIMCESFNKVLMNKCINIIKKTIH